MNAEELYEMTDMLLGRCGRMLSASKQASPKKNIVWNGNIFMSEAKRYGFGEDITKIWFGDISLAASAPDLLRLASGLDATLYVLRERDGVGENENNPDLNKAVAMAIPGAKELVYA